MHIDDISLYRYLHIDYLNIITVEPDDHEENNVYIKAKGGDLSLQNEIASAFKVITSSQLLIN